MHDDLMMRKHDRFFENVNGHDYRTTHVMTSQNLLRVTPRQLAERPGTAWHCSVRAGTCLTRFASFRVSCVFFPFRTSFDECCRT